MRKIRNILFEIITYNYSISIEEIAEMLRLKGYKWSAETMNMLRDFERDNMIEIVEDTVINKISKKWNIMYDTVNGHRVMHMKKLV